MICKKNILKTTIAFTREDLNKFVLQISERIEKPITYASPIVDSTLPDGSRINIVYGEDVSKRGSNFTIRKFNARLLSILDIIGSNTMVVIIQSAVRRPNGQHVARTRSTSSTKRSKSTGISLKRSTIPGSPTTMSFSI